MNDAAPVSSQRSLQRRPAASRPEKRRKWTPWLRSDTTDANGEDQSVARLAGVMFRRRCRVPLSGPVSVTSHFPPDPPSALSYPGRKWNFALAALVLVVIAGAAVQPDALHHPNFWISSIFALPAA